MGFTEGPASIETATPNLDRLVKEGVRLDRHYVHYVCTRKYTSNQPSAGMHSHNKIITQRYSWRNTAICLCL